MQKLILTLLVYTFFINIILGQEDTTALKNYLLGKWEVIKYAEQGLQVNKKQDVLPQAQAVYAHIARQRAQQYYGYDIYTDERHTRAFERWQEEDRAREINRAKEAIAMPYFAVFFADSTLATYNKDTSGIYFPESWHFIFVPKTMSMDIMYPGGGSVRWQAQVRVLTRERLVLFLPEDAEVVELVKVSGDLP